MIENIYKINYNGSNGTIIKQGENVCMEKINKIIDDFKNTESLADFFNIINSEKDFEKISPSEYRIGNKTLFVGSKYNMEQTAKNLYEIEDLNLTCAPKLIKTCLNKNKKYQIILCQMPETLYPYEEKQNAVSLNSKAKFVSEVNKLYKTVGKYNPLTYDKRFWHVDTDGNIFIPDWSSLENFSNDQEKRNLQANQARMMGFVFY